MTTTLRTGFLVVLTALWLFSGCAGKPPKEERERAELAFRAAKIAEKCAPVRYTSAEKALEQARQLLTEKKYDESRRYFVVARELSDKALEEARANKNCSETPAGGPGDEAPDVGAAENEPADPAVNNPNYELGMVFFPFNSSEVSAEAEETLKKNAQWMNRFPDVKVLIEGHCDARGGAEYNLSLGERRANTVRKFLVLLNVNPDSLDVISYGEERPLVEEDSEEAYARNRRASFVKQWKR